MSFSSLGCLYSPSVVVSSLDVLRVGQLKCKGSYDVTKRQAVEDICSAAVELQEGLCVKHMHSGIYFPRICIMYPLGWKKVKKIIYLKKKGIKKKERDCGKGKTV